MKVVMSDIYCNDMRFWEKENPVDVDTHKRRKWRRYIAVTSKGYGWSVVTNQCK